MLQMFVKSLWIVKGIFVWTLHKVPRVVEKVCYAWTIMILIITLLGTSAHPVSHGHPDEGSASPAGGELCGHHASGLGTPLGDWPRAGRCCWWVLWELVLTILQGRLQVPFLPHVYLYLEYIKPIVTPHCVLNFWLSWNPSWKQNMFHPNISAMVDWA